MLYDCHNRGKDREGRDVYRRELMRSIAAAAALVPVSTLAAKSPFCIEECQEIAAILAASMQEMFGGHWRVSVQTDFILISKES